MCVCGGGGGGGGGEQQTCGYNLQILLQKSKYLPFVITKCYECPHLIALSMSKVYA